MFNRKNRIENLDTYVEERLSDYLDGTLSPQERELVEAHLATSERAHESLESLRYTVNLLRQTPAPPMPRQFTLPVTTRAPARGTPGWMVWGLRGIAIGATASFVVLLTVTLLRQPNVLQMASAPAAAVPAQPTAIVAYAPAPSPLAATEANEALRTNQSAPVVQPTTVPTQVMITTVPESAQEVQPITVIPDTAVEDSAEPTEPQPFIENTAPPPPPQPERQPTQADTSNLELAQATQAPPTADDTDASAAAGSSGPENTPVLAPAAGLAATPTDSTAAQRKTIQTSTEGIVTTSDLRVREGPGIEFDTIGSLKLDDRVLVVGRDTNSNWLAIEYPQNLETGIGWVGALFMEVSIPLEMLPVLDATGAQVPTATPTSAESLDEAPTESPTDSPTLTPEPSSTP